MENKKGLPLLTSRLRTRITIRPLWSCTVTGSIMPSIADKWGIFPGVLIGLGFGSLLLIASQRLPQGRPARWYDVVFAFVFLAVTAVSIHYTCALSRH